METSRYIIGDAVQHERLTCDASFSFLEALRPALGRALQAPATQERAASCVLAASCDDHGMRNIDPAHHVWPQQDLSNTSAYERHLSIEIHIRSSQASSTSPLRTYLLISIAA